MLTRRSLLRVPGGTLLSAAASSFPSGKVRDHFWMWGHAAGSHNKSWNLPGPSRITPVEAAYYMGVPNVIQVRYEGDPAPPFQQYAVPFRPLKQVVWSVVGAGGETGSAERDAVLKLAVQNTNFSGVMMDDFFTDKKDGKIGNLTVEELQTLKERLKAERKLDLWVVVYDRQLDDPIAGHLKYCDVMTYWTWRAAALPDLRANFEKAERLTPGLRKVLGCYMWDYGEKKPMPVAALQRQCEQGLEWLRQGRIHGMIFLATCICDLGLDAVEWTRCWIQKVGDQKLR
jgi:hypothetical protein